jgi:hypothetical protein
MTLSEHIKHHHTGAKRSNDVCKHICESRKGQFTDAQRNALHNLQSKQIGENNPMYGKRHTEASRKKMSDSHKTQSSSFKGCCHSENAKTVISEKLHAYHEKMRSLFTTYKNNGGTLKYFEFCKNFKSGAITLDD